MIAPVNLTWTFGELCQLSDIRYIRPRIVADECGRLIQSKMIEYQSEVWMGSNDRNQFRQMPCSHDEKRNCISFRCREESFVAPRHKVFT